MSFQDCGKLNSTSGSGFKPPWFFKIKNGVFEGNLEMDEHYFSSVNNDKLVFPVEIKKVTGYFSCARLELKSLEGCPEEIEYGFNCSNNYLTSLKGCPKIVGGLFNCSLNNLKNLEGAPNVIDDTFLCYDNDLTSLKGCPEKIGDFFNCSQNQLTNLEGCPKIVGGDFICKNNAKQFTEEEVRAVCDVKGKVYV